MRGEQIRVALDRDVERRRHGLARRLRASLAPGVAGAGVERGGVELPHPRGVLRRGYQLGGALSRAGVGPVRLAEGIEVELREVGELPPLRLLGRQLELGGQLGAAPPALRQPLRLVY